MKRKQARAEAEPDTSTLANEISGADAVENYASAMRQNEALIIF